MRYTLKEEDILESFKLHNPEYEFEKGRLLVGQHNRDDLKVYYLGTQDFFAVMTIEFSTFDFKDTLIFDKNEISEIRLKEGLIYRKMSVTFGENVLKYGTSKLLLSDFQKDNFNSFIKGDKERVIYQSGQFL